LAQCHGADIDTDDVGRESAGPLSPARESAELLDRRTSCRPDPAPPAGASTPRVFDGETRIRTGDTTIFSRYVLVGQAREDP
jgi:hypothetical protein